MFTNEILSFEKFKWNDLYAKVKNFEFIFTKSINKWRYKKKFTKKFKNFFPFKQIKKHNYKKLFLNYDKLYYKLDEIVFKKGQELDDIYFIVNGIFEIYKKQIIKNNIKIN